MLEMAGDFQQFKRILGNVPVSAFNHETLNALVDTLGQLPPNINKIPALRDKPIPEILAMGLTPQSAVTVKKKWTRLIAFGVWLKGRGLVDENYAEGKKPKALNKSYEKFSEDDLKRLFEGEEFTNGSFSEPFQYWLPVLGLYTGARLEELAQLHLADISKDSDTGYWALSITPYVDEKAGAATEKRLKNAASDRVCPIHTALIDAGLLDYIEDLKRRGYDRLFPELIPDAQQKVSGRASEWFTEYRRGKGVGSPTGKSPKVFHSFRHTMNTALQRENVEQHVREVLCGHQPTAVNTRVYGEQPRMEVLKQAINKLDYDMKITPFKVSEEHEVRRQRAIRRANRTR